MHNDELQKLLNSVEGKSVFTPIYIASTTGMRLGEVCGLQNEDVDIKKKIFYIRHTYKRISGEMVLKNTKTLRSKRPVPMLPGTDVILKEYISKKEQYSEELGSDYTFSSFFCTWEDGRPMQPDYVTSTFKKYIRRLKFSEGITFHSLRHTHASWLLREKIHPKIVSERLGHTSVNLTLNIYSHLIPDLQKDVLSGLDTSLFTVKSSGNSDNKIHLVK